MEAAAREFYASSRHLHGFDPARFVRAWTGILESDMGVIFALFDGERVDGAIGGVIYPDLYSGDLIAVEFFWFIQPERRGEGLKLYRAFEAWAREKRCAQIQMAHLSDLMPEKLKTVYARLGFEAIETRYAKELKP